MDDREDSVLSEKAAIGLINPKSPDNVGAVLRAAGCYGVETVYYTGTRFERAAKYQLDTKQRSETIALTLFNAIQAIEKQMQLVTLQVDLDNVRAVLGPDWGD